MIKADDLAKKINAKLNEAHRTAIVDGIARTEEAITKAAEQLKFRVVVTMPCAFAAQRVVEKLDALGYRTIRCDPDQAIVLTDEARIADAAGSPRVEWSLSSSAGWTRGRHMTEGNESGDRERIPVPTSIVIFWD